MRYAIGLGVGLLILFGAMLVFSYMTPGGASILGRKVSLSQVEYRASGQLANAGCYYDSETGEQYCDQVEWTQQTPPSSDGSDSPGYYNEPNYYNEPYYNEPVYDYSHTYYDSQGVPVDVYEENNTVDANGNPVYYDEPYYYNEPAYDYSHTYYDQLGPVDVYEESNTLVDIWGNPLNYGPADEWDDVNQYDYIDEYYNDQYSSRYSVRAPDPWYVTAFPGIGKMVQQMIPGQQVRTTQPIIQPVIQPVQQRPVYPQPSCWISAQPTTVLPGGSSVLNWASSNATQATLTGLGRVPTTGSHTVNGITGTQTFTLQVAGQGGNGSCYTRVSAQQVSGPPSCTISVNPSIVSAGQSANLAWFSQNAVSASLTGYGQVPVQGGRSVTPLQSAIFTLNVTGGNGQTSSCAAHLTVR